MGKLQPSCGNGALCQGRFDAKEGTCVVTVSADGFGSCSAEIEYPGNEHWLDVVASPNEAGGIDCSVRRVEQSCNALQQLLQTLALASEAG